MRVFTKRFFCARGTQALDQVIQALDEISRRPAPKSRPET